VAGSKGRLAWFGNRGHFRLFLRSAKYGGVRRGSGLTVRLADIIARLRLRRSSSAGARTRRVMYCATRLTANAADTKALY